MFVTVARAQGASASTNRRVAKRGLAVRVELASSSFLTAFIKNAGPELFLVVQGFQKHSWAAVSGDLKIFLRSGRAPHSWVNDGGALSRRRYGSKLAGEDLFGPTGEVVGGRAGVSLAKQLVQSFHGNSLGQTLIVLAEAGKCVGYSDQPRGYRSGHDRH